MRARSRPQRNWTLNSQYNLLPYNALQYNVTEAIEITISHSMTPVDSTLVKFPMLPKVDSILASDDLTKQITDKRLLETVRANIWFTLKNAPQSDPWS